MSAQFITAEIQVCTNILSYSNRSEDMWLGWDGGHPGLTV